MNHYDESAILTYRVFNKTSLLIISQLLNPKGTVYSKVSSMMVTSSYRGHICIKISDRELHGKGK